jgi:hypothetical protein
MNETKWYIQFHSLLWLRVLILQILVCFGQLSDSFRINKFWTYNLKAKVKCEKVNIAVAYSRLTWKTCRTQSLLISVPSHHWQYGQKSKMVAHGKDYWRSHSSKAPDHIYKNRLAWKNLPGTNAPPYFLGVPILQIYVNFEQLLDSFRIDKYWTCNLKAKAKVKKLISQFHTRDWLEKLVEHNHSQFLFRAISDSTAKNLKWLPMARIIGGVIQVKLLAMFTKID